MIALLLLAALALHKGSAGGVSSAPKDARALVDSNTRAARVGR